MAESHYLIRKAPGIHCEIREMADINYKISKVLNPSVISAKRLAATANLRNAGISYKVHKKLNSTVETAIRQNPLPSAKNGRFYCEGCERLHPL